MPNLPRQPHPTHTRSIRQAWNDERSAARLARSAGDRTTEWRHLERAHILSQPIAIAHVRTHGAMLSYGIRHRDRREITGQLIRLLVAGPGSVTRRYPLGNTGGANVSAVVAMPIPDDLEAIIASTATVTS